MTAKLSRIIHCHQSLLPRISWTTARWSSYFSKSQFTEWSRLYRASVGSVLLRSSKTGRGAKSVDVWTSLSSTLHFVLRGRLWLTDGSRRPVLDMGNSMRRLPSLLPHLGAAKLWSWSPRDPPNRQLETVYLYYSLLVRLFQHTMLWRSNLEQITSVNGQWFYKLTGPVYPRPGTEWCFRGKLVYHVTVSVCESPPRRIAFDDWAFEHW